MNKHAANSAPRPVLRNFEDGMRQLEEKKWLSTLSTSFEEESAKKEDFDRAFNYVMMDTANNLASDDALSFRSRCLRCIDFVGWLERDAAMSVTNKTWTVASWFRYFVYDPSSRQFADSSSHSFSFAFVVGITMALFVALFKPVIEKGMKIIYEDIPGVLNRLGCPHLYMYPLVMMVLFGGVAANQFSGRIQMPDQNSLLEDHRSHGGPKSGEFWYLIFYSTLGMWSGQSLGPELPLLISSAMIGTWICDYAKLDKLKDRQLVVLMAQSASISAFFKLPVGGAFFVSELPCRTGPLQIDASFVLSILSSIIAAAVYSLISNEAVGDSLFVFPEIPDSFPSWIYIPVLGLCLLGVIVGIIYLKVVKWWKIMEHDLIDVFKSKGTNRKHRFNALGWFRFVMRCLPGIFSGVACIFLPHTFSWGEGQLQTLIDGKSPLPYFGNGSPLVSPFAKCMPNEEGLSLGCLTVIPLVKMVITGMSLGSGVRCGHFWGPLFVGGAFGQLLWAFLGYQFGFRTEIIESYLSVAILCTMASAHTVTFRSYLGISTILTQASGQRHHVFVAILASAVVATLLSQDVVFYKAQRDSHTMFKGGNRNRVDSTRSAQLSLRSQGSGDELLLSDAGVTMQV